MILGMPPFTAVHVLLFYVITGVIAVKRFRLEVA